MQNNAKCKIGDNISSYLGCRCLECEKEINISFVVDIKNNFCDCINFADIYYPEHKIKKFTLCKYARDLPILPDFKHKETISKSVNIE